MVMNQYHGIESFKKENKKNQIQENQQPSMVDSETRQTSTSWYGAFLQIQAIVLP